MQQFWVAASLLWLAGVGLRLTILAVPPVIALMQADLALTGTQVGILSGLPVILFGIAALPGSLLIARFGALATMVGGLMVAGVFSGLRGALLDVYWLYATTIVMSAGIAVMQPALPAAGAAVDAAEAELRHRAVHQRAAGRRNAAGDADAVAGVSAGGRIPGDGRWCSGACRCC